MCTAATPSRRSAVPCCACFFAVAVTVVVILNLGEEMGASTTATSSAGVHVLQPDAALGASTIAALRTQLAEADAALALMKAGAAAPRAADGGGGAAAGATMPSGSPAVLPAAVAAGSTATLPTAQPPRTTAAASPAVVTAAATTATGAPDLAALSAAADAAIAKIDATYGAQSATLFNREALYRFASPETRSWLVKQVSFCFLYFDFI